MAVMSARMTKQTFPALLQGAYGGAPPATREADKVHKQGKSLSVVPSRVLPLADRSTGFQAFASANRRMKDPHIIAACNLAGFSRCEAAAQHCRDELHPLRVVL